MNKNTLSYILIGLLCSLIVVVITNTTSTINKTFFRPEEVAVADDILYETDSEGRIYVKNTFKPQSKTNILVEMEENKDKQTEIVVNGTQKNSIEELMTIDNIRTTENDLKQREKLEEEGNKYLNEIIDYRQKEYDEQKRKEEEERKKQLELENEKNIIYTGSDDLRKPSGLTSSQLEKGLKHNLKGLGSTFITAEKIYNVNAVFLASVAALESNWGRSNYAKNRNNLFGYGAYTSNPDHAYYFESKEQAVYFVAKKLSEDYLTSSGKFFSGYTLEGVNKRYCTNPNWANSVGKIMKEFY